MRPAVLLAVLTALALPAAGLAAVPSPANSTLPGCIKASPDASLPTIVVVRDAANNPVNGSVVVLGYADCPTFAPCPAAGPPIDDYLVDYGTKTLRTTTNAAGQAIFHLRAGGGCQVYPITIFADGVFLGARRAASTDQNGNGIVDAIDVIILTAKVGGSDLTGDLDCDGVVDNYDLSIQDGSLGSACPTVNPTRETSWGRVKTIYR